MVDTSVETLNIMGNHRTEQDSNANCEICSEALIEALLPNSRAARLLEEIQSKAGVKSITKSDIHCTSCPKGLNARAYFEAPPAKIVLCSNKLYTPSEVEESLVHELVHAYDYVVYGANLENCMELARSEVRAAREAECHYSFQVIKDSLYLPTPSNTKAALLLIVWDNWLGLRLIIHIFFSLLSLALQLLMATLH